MSTRTYILLHLVYCKLRKKRAGLEIIQTGISLFYFSFSALETEAPSLSGFRSNILLNYAFKTNVDLSPNLMSLCQLNNIVCYSVCCFSMERL